MKMGKNNQKSLRETHLESHRQKKISVPILLYSILMVFLCVNFVSALDWDTSTLYYDMANSTEISIGKYNLTARPDGTGNFVTEGCLIGLCGNFSEDAGWLIPNNFDINLSTPNRTLNFWFNSTIVTGTHSLFDNQLSTRMHILIESGNLSFNGVFAAAYNDVPVITNKWYMVTLSHNDSSMSVYINGTLWKTASDASIANIVDNINLGSNYNEGSEYYGKIDEISYWNTSLTSFDVIDLYNLGNGSSYGNITGHIISVTLDSPVGNSVLSAIEENFSATYSATGYDLANATYYIYNSSGGIFNNSEVVIITGTSNTSSKTIDAFVIGDYKWNVYACGDNLTATACFFATNNLSFNVGASIGTEVYNNYTYETSNEYFSTNVSLLEGTTIYIAELSYNNTHYTGTATDIGSNDWFINHSIDIPLISTAKNLSFHWRLTYQKNDGTFVYQNLTSHQQRIEPIALGDCTGNMTTVTLNFTSWDEELLTKLSGFNFEATFHYWLGHGGTKENVSFNNPNIQNKSICINPSHISYYLTDSDIDYSANFTGYVDRSYYFENDTLTNVTQDIELYLLNSSDSTSFILKVLDQNQQAVENAIIYSDRYYPGLGEYKTVQIAKTNENGKSIGFFKTETVDYRFTIEKSGVTELIAPKQKIIPEETPYTLLFTIGVSLETPWADFEDLEGLDYSLLFNSTSNITTFTYIDTSGNFTQGRLLVKELMYNQSDIVICNTTSTSATATITCDASGYSGSFIAQAFITRTVEKTISVLPFIISTIVQVMGLLGLMLGWFIILVAGCTGFWHPVAGIVMVEASIIFVNLIGLLSWSPMFLFGSLAVAVILIFVLKD